MSTDARKIIKREIEARDAFPREYQADVTNAMKVLVLASDPNELIEACAREAGKFDGRAANAIRALAVPHAPAQDVGMREMARRLVVEFDDHHYPGCPKEASDNVRCECFAGALIAEAKAALAAPQRCSEGTASEPVDITGWKLVPDQPTEEMWQAGRSADIHPGDSYTKVWCAMFEAAPNVDDCETTSRLAGDGATAPERESPSDGAIYAAVSQRDMTPEEIAAFANCRVIEEAGVYRVMSNNDICLFQSANIVRAYEYAEWFQGRSK